MTFAFLQEDALNETPSIEDGAKKEGGNGTATATAAAERRISRSQSMSIANLDTVTLISKPEPDWMTPDLKKRFIVAR
jgi:hypothetical protein